MRPFLGVVIEQSLADSSFLDTVEIVHRERAPDGTWVFLLVRVPQEGSAGAFARLQSALEPGAPWYAHFFRDTELVVVFRDAIVSMSTDPATWGPALAHGARHGIPAAQLDFEPHTLEGVVRRFGVSPTA